MIFNQKVSVSELTTIVLVDFDRSSSDSGENVFIVVGNYVHIVSEVRDIRTAIVGIKISKNDSNRFHKQFRGRLWELKG